MTKMLQSESKEIILPDSKATLKIKNSLNFGISLDMGDFESQKEANLFMIKEMIVSWDFTNDEEKELPITIDNIKNLSPLDGQFIVNQITSYLGVEDKKKESLS